MHGYKAPVATDQDAGLIRGVEATTANVHDAAELAAILPAGPGDTHGDTAYSGSRPEAAIRARGGTPRIVHTGTWGGAEALARLRVHNAEVRRVRARIEKVFGTCQRSYGLRRMRWLGLAKAGLQVRGCYEPHYFAQERICWALPFITLSCPGLTRVSTPMERQRQRSSAPV